MLWEDKIHDFSRLQLNSCFQKVGADIINLNFATVYALKFESNLKASGSERQNIGAVSAQYSNSHINKFLQNLGDVPTKVQRD